jgi:thymidylate synthase (FAD)
MDNNQGTVCFKRFIYNDDIGYVELIEKMGDQYTPSEDARMSTGKGRLGPEKDSALQKRLLKDKHTSPFEGVVVKFELCVPLFVLRELDRHRTLTKITDQEVGWNPGHKGDLIDATFPEEGGRKWFSRNEMSGRYVQLPAQYYYPEEVRYQSKNNNQAGSTQTPLDGFHNALTNTFLERGRKVTEEARELYDWAVKNNIEKGLARIFNTQNQYTRIRMTGSLKNWLDFLSLRLEEGVVLHECREVALAIEYILEQHFPDVMKTWRNEVYNVVTITKNEAAIVKHLLHLMTMGAEVNPSFFTDIEKLKEKLK